MFFVNHLGKATLKQELFDVGVLLEIIKYFAHQMHDGQTELHTLSLAADALVNRADAEAMDLKNIPILIVFEVLKELMEEVLPCLAKSIRHINEKCNEKWKETKSN